MQRIAPCYNCPLRTQKCHSKCDAYKGFANRIAEENVIKIAAKKESSEQADFLYMENIRSVFAGMKRKSSCR